MEFTLIDKNLLKNDLGNLKLAYILYNELYKVVKKNVTKKLTKGKTEKLKKSIETEIKTVFGDIKSLSLIVGPSTGYFLLQVNFYDSGSFFRQQRLTFAGLVGSNNTPIAIGPFVLTSHKNTVVDYRQKIDTKLKQLEDSDKINELYKEYNKKVFALREERKTVSEKVSILTSETDV